MKDYTAYMSNVQVEQNARSSADCTPVELIESNIIPVSATDPNKSNPNNDNLALMTLGTPHTDNTAAVDC